MKKLFIPFTVLLLLAACQGKQSSSVQENQIVIGKIDSLRSDILDETRAIWVHVPGDDDESRSTVRYPVIYLLDGPGHFSTVTGMIQQMKDNTICPEMIVVGIPNTDRTRDLTPTHVDVGFGGDSTGVVTSGGGDKFLDFIEKELIPYIDKNYPAARYKTYVGHSYGGIAVLHALFRRPYLFNNYIAIDPSLWWDDQVLLPVADSVFTHNNYEGKSLYVAIANTMGEGLVLEDVLKDTSENSLHIRSNFQFVHATEEKPDNGLLFSWKYYGDDDHGSVTQIAEYDALRFFFPWYKLRGLQEFFLPDSEHTAEELIQLFTSHYENVSEHMGYTVLPPEDDINQLGYYFMERKPDFAYALFNLNIENYPGSPNVYDSMGDYYMSQSDTTNAIKHYTRAVEIGDYAPSKEKLEKLQE